MTEGPSYYDAFMAGSMYPPEAYTAAADADFYDRRQEIVEYLNEEPTENRNAVLADMVSQGRATAVELEDMNLIDDFGELAEYMTADPAEIDDDCAGLD